MNLSIFPFTLDQKKFHSFQEWLFKHPSDADRFIIDQRYLSGFYDTDLFIVDQEGMMYS